MRPGGGLIGPGAPRRARRHTLAAASLAGALVFIASAAFFASSPSSALPAVTLGLRQTADEAARQLSEGARGAAAPAPAARGAADGEAPRRAAWADATEAADDEAAAAGALRAQQGALAAREAAGEAADAQPEASRFVAGAEAADEDGAGAEAAGEDGSAAAAKKAAAAAGARVAAAAVAAGAGADLPPPAATAARGAPTYPLPAFPEHAESARVARERPVSMLAVFARFSEHAGWLTEESSGMVLSNATGTPELVAPSIVYQAANIGADLAPSFPGLPPSASLADCAPLPAWPAWARAWVASRARSRILAPPGSADEADLSARLRLGLPWEPTLEGKKNALEYLGADPEAAADPPQWAAALALVAAARAAGGGDLHAPDPALEAMLARGEYLSLNASAPFPPPAASLSPAGAAAKAAAAAATGAAEPGAAADGAGAAPPRGDVADCSARHPDAIAPVPVHIVPNRGAEWMAYVTAIVEHYDDLPDLMIFQHGHRCAWHSPMCADWVLRRLATHPPRSLLDRPSMGGYAPLACDERFHSLKTALFLREMDGNVRSNNGPRWHEAVAARSHQAWDEYLSAALGEPMPEYTRAPSAASFAATRAAIRRRPRAFWEGLRAWMLETSIENKWLGIVLEFNAGLLFSGAPVVDFSQEHLMCELYSICTLPAWN